MPLRGRQLAALRRHRVPSWWRDAKLGIFVHWTPASVPAFAPVDVDIGELVFTLGGGARFGYSLLWVVLLGTIGIVVFAHLVIGEMVPKSIALAQPEGTLMTLAVPTAGFVWLFTPVIWILNRLAKFGARTLGVEPADELRSAATSAALGMPIAVAAAPDSRRA